METNFAQIIIALGKSAVIFLALLSVKKKLRQLSGEVKPH